jgi:hypothetical protein
MRRLVRPTNRPEPPLRKPDHAARRTIIREWMALPSKQRASEDQAAAFVAKASERHTLKDHGDTTERMMGWLRPRVGKS